MESCFEVYPSAASKLNRACCSEKRQKQVADVMGKRAEAMGKSGLKLRLKLKDDHDLQVKNGGAW